MGFGKLFRLTTLKIKISFILIVIGFLGFGGGYMSGAEPFATIVKIVFLPMMVVESTVSIVLWVLYIYLLTCIIGSIIESMFSEIK